MSKTSRDEDLELIEIRNEFIDESLEGLAGAAEHIVLLEHNPSDTKPIDSIFRTAHSIKGNAAYFELMSLKTLAHRIEDVLGALRKKQLRPSRKVVDDILVGIDALSEMLSRVRDRKEEIDDPRAFEDLITRLSRALQTSAPVHEQLIRLQRVLDELAGVQTVIETQDAAGLIKEAKQICVTIGGNKEGDDQKPASSKATPSKATSDFDEIKPKESKQDSGAESQSKTMRIREESIDGFFKYVGDLVVVGEMYDNLQRQLAQKRNLSTAAKSLKTVNDSFRSLSQGLQKSILNIRKIPARKLIHRSTRIVRDVATAQGKEIELKMSGESELIDKSIAEALEAPLVHMVRNAADHGIETPDVRLNAAKLREGCISISVNANPDSIVLSVEDDGKGLDREKLRQKAVSMGLISPNQELNDEAMVGLLFQAGVSTAEQVTEVSGRGVGMDVVKRNIDSIGGKIEVDSTPGKGSIFRIVMPAAVTTSIIHGIGVMVKNERYILPMEFVIRFFQIEDDTLNYTKGKDACVQVDGKTVRLHSLAEVLGLAPQTDGKSFSNGPAVLTKLENEYVAFAVDEIEAHRQVVLKEISGMNVENDLFKGGAIMGDGTVSLVINLEKLNSSLGQIVGY
ncbi:MAG: chemotaxis protein CheA [Deltaproteobacteria bacterium]|nr:chemotaxis protein CheA [Deltaproteobacteria bacterium]